MTTSLPLPAGFKTAGLHCGVKKDPENLDLSLFVSDLPCASAGVFTQNRVCGAPVKVSRERLPAANIRGVVINSGNSNACTGERGIADAKWMTAEVAKRVGCAGEQILVCSTGVIGRFLPKEPLQRGFETIVPQLGATPEHFQLAARGMMTTDTHPKQSSRTATIQGKKVMVSGCSKGAAMIAPNMATMLCMIMTDAGIDSATADQMLRQAVGSSFNCISVEGHTSTSDTVLLLANGGSGTKNYSAAELETIQQMITEVAEDLAQAIINDAEGATHIITIDVQGLRTREEAFTIAKAVADSPLNKTAIAGADPNWGRIVSSCGYAGVDLQEENISLWLNGVLLYKSGVPQEFDAAAVSAGIRNQRQTHVDLKFDLGTAGVRYWTADLTAEYVRLNADYTT